MSRSSSSTSSQSTTQEISQDQRALADNSGVALSSSTLNYTEAFPEPVAKAFQDLISLSKAAGDIVIETNAKLVETTKSALDKFAAIKTGETVAAVQSSPVGSTTLQNTESVKYIALAVVGVAALIFLLQMRKK